jgi:Poly(ADP-ribose) polymerase and DNA-Ligase Zn-finger region
MPHVIERAATGRAKCRGCGGKIAADQMRFGERLPNPFADDGGEMTQWFHVACGALTRPEPFLETLPTVAGPIDDRAWLEHEARLGATHRRLPRVRAAERAASGRATCRACREPIPKDAWRIALQYYEDGRFVPSGFIHARCAASYLETTDLLRRVRHFSPDLGDDDLRGLSDELAVGDPPAA